MSEAASNSANAAQIEAWNGVAGETWARFQAQLDRQIRPLGLEAMRALKPAPGETILDVGCGCGETSVELASRVGASGAVVGADISIPMLKAARARAVPSRAATPEFRQADVQTAMLAEGVFDAVFSRFGVMFFSDPVAAFSNLRKGMKPEGRLAFVCWRGFEENLWMRVPMEAALPLLPPSPPLDPKAPGPFAFADPDRVRSILEAAGFSDISLDAYQTVIGGSNLDQTVDLALRVGPLGAILREQTHLAGSVAAAVGAALLAYEASGEVLMPASVWIVQARAGSLAPPGAGSAADPQIIP